MDLWPNAIETPFNDVKGALVPDDDTNILTYIKGLQSYVSGVVSSFIFPTPPDYDPTKIVIPDVVSWSIDYDFIYNLLQGIINDLPGDPEYLEINTDTATLDTLKTIPDMASIPIPEFAGSMPPVDFGDSPVWEDFGDTPTEPTVSSYPTPDKPAYTFPTEPVLSNVNLPSPITIDIPTFDETLLDEDLITPTNTFAFSEGEYTSLLKTAVYDKLLDEVTNGGYGLDSTDEQLLFDREREREARSNNGVILDSVRAFAGNGFTLPQGSLLKIVKNINQDFINKTSSVNRDIAIKRADLYMQGKQFTIQQSISLETVLMNLHNSRKERELNAAKIMIQVAIDIFNAEIARYKARQERFIALTEVFKTRIQAELAKVEIYKAQMDGAKTEVSINQSLVDLYKARVSTVNAVMEVYKTDASIFEILNNVEKIKFDIFRAQIDAYIAQVQAKKIEFDAYDSKVKGELGKVEVYRTEAGAYASIIDGKKAAIQAEATKLSAYVEQNKGIIEAFKAETEQYNSIREMQKSYNEGQATIFKTKGDVISSEANAIGKIADAYTSATESQYKMTALQVQINTEIAKLQLEQAIEISKLYVEFDKAKIDFYRSYIASVMSIINFNGSIAASVSSSASVSNSDSYSESHNFDGAEQPGVKRYTDNTNYNYNL